MTITNTTDGRRRVRPTTAMQRAILRAVEAGHTTCRAIMAETGITTTSVVASNLRRMADRGEVILEETPRGTVVYTGRDFAQAWNLAARLAGNHEA